MMALPALCITYTNESLDFIDLRSMTVNAVVIVEATELLT